MKNEFKLTINDIYIFSNGQACLVGDAEPIEHDLITSSYVAKIIIDGVEDRKLNIMGQDILARNPNLERIEFTSIRTTDNVEDLRKYLGKKSIVVIGYLPD